MKYISRIQKSALNIAKFKYLAKQIINSFSPGHKLSNDKDYETILRVFLSFFNLKKLPVN